MIQAALKAIALGEGIRADNVVEIGWLTCQGVDVAGDSAELVYALEEDEWLRLLAAIGR